VLVEVTRRATPVGTVRQVVHPVEMTRKADLLRLLLERPEIGPTLVFTRTKSRANQLFRRFGSSTRRLAVIHGGKSQNARTRALDGFRQGRVDTLIATDIAARGLDVEGISHVVNFDLPHVAEDYVHRIGRTARAGRAGDAISFAAPEEQRQLAAIERLTGARIRCEPIAGFAPQAGALEARPHPRTRSKPWNGPGRARQGAGQHRAPARARRPF